MCQTNLFMSINQTDALLTEIFKLKNLFMINTTPDPELKTKPFQIYLWNFPYMR